MVMNFDQAPLKYIPVSSQTLPQNSARHVSIYGVTYKKAIKATFSITYTNKFLPMQLIYEDKNQRSYPNFDFPHPFSLSCNPKHFTNTKELLKLIYKIIVPYLEKEQEKLKIEQNHWRLLIIDEFPGQMTDTLLAKLKENYIKLVRVPKNMIQIFQPLDLTGNGSAKSYLKRQLTEWFSVRISDEFNSGKELVLHKK